MSSRMPANLVISTLEMDEERRGHPPEVSHHSDKRSQYTSQLFKTRCLELGVQLSMDSVGDYNDNAIEESFLAALVCKLINMVQIFKGTTEG